MRFTKAIDGFLLHKRVEQLSLRTLELYEHQLNHLALYLDDPELESIAPDDIKRFLDYLRYEYIPKRWGGDNSPLSPRSIHNYWISFKSFWTWAKFDLNAVNVMDRIPTPHATVPEPMPLTEDEILRLLQACGQTTDGRKHPFEHRNKAVLLVLLDTGIRASELCNLKRMDYDQNRGKLTIAGKGAKERIVFLGNTARKALWRYLATRDDADDPDVPLFANQRGKSLARHWLRRVLAEMGKRAGVERVSPHRFRYTFAIQYLRNRGDIFTLQRLLGHSSLKMVRYYLALADVDTETAHRRASPADNWNL